MPLEIDGARGDAYLAAQQRVLDDWLTLHADHDCIVTPLHRPSRLDALVVKGGTLAMIAEVKTKPESLARLRERGSYMISMSKLNDGQAFSRALCVPFVLMLGLTDALLFWRLTDDHGAWTLDDHGCTAFTVERNRLVQTVNGGEPTRRDVALLRLSVAKIESEHA